MPQRMMNIDEVARHLHVEPREVAQWVLQGEIPFEHDVSHPVFRHKEIDAWASQRILGMREKRLTSYHRETSQHEQRATDAPFVVCELLTSARTRFALDSRTKASVLRDLVAIAEQEEILYDPKDLVRSLEAREELCSTGLVGGVAIIHPRHHDPYIASEAFLILAQAAHPIGFGAPDGKPTDIFFLLVATDDRYHLQALARLCMMMINTKLLDNLRAAASAAEMHRVVVAAEQAILSTIK